MKRALAMARELEQDGITDTDDPTLCRLVEAELTEELDGLLPATPPVEPTKPIDRGATAQTDAAGKPKPTTLRNDLAAQRAGKPPQLSDEELYEAALRQIEVS